jgi:hypothetical protein
MHITKLDYAGKTLNHSESGRKCRAEKQQESDREC